MFVMELDARRTRTLTLRVPVGVNERLEKAYRDLGYSTKSDFIREAIIEYINEALKRGLTGSSIGNGKNKIHGKSRPAVSRNARLVVVR
ncbi:MAG: ribbon-helix-helix domain-containing protein [Zestosphaera sp.]